MFLNENVPERKCSKKLISKIAQARGSHDQKGQESLVIIHRFTLVPSVILLSNTSLIKQASSRYLFTRSNEKIKPKCAKTLS